MSAFELRPFDQFAYLLLIILEALFLLLVFIFCVRVFKQHKMPISQHYTWGVRMGLLIFCFTIAVDFLVHYFIFNGIGYQQSDDYLRIINQWDHPVGGLRLFYLMGIFSLQSIPMVSFYIFSKKKEVIIFSICYFVCMLLMFVMTLMKLPLQPF